MVSLLFSSDDSFQQILEHKRVKQVLAKRGETLESTKRERIVVTTSNHRRSRSQEDQDGNESNRK